MHGRRIRKICGKRCTIGNWIQSASHSVLSNDVFCLVSCCLNSVLAHRALFSRLFRKLLRNIIRSGTLFHWVWNDTANRSTTFQLDIIISVRNARNTSLRCFVSILLFTQSCLSSGKCNFFIASFRFATIKTRPVKYYLINTGSAASGRRWKSTFRIESDLHGENMHWTLTKLHDMNKKRDFNTFHCQLARSFSGFH